MHITSQCHGHAHKHASSSIDIELKYNGHQDHSHSSGICCISAHRSSEDSWLNDLGDVERGPPNFERIVLLIDGLQCGCCEGGLSRTVTRIAAIKNHKLNVVLAKLEFDLDTNHMSVSEVIKRLNTKTGYTFTENVELSGQVLEFVVNNSEKLQHAGKPFGVTRIELPEKQPWHRSLLRSGRNSTYIVFAGFWPLEGPHAFAIMLARI